MAAVGETLGRYRLEALLGEGGMGKVFRAFDDVLKRRVALKVLRDDSGLGDEGKARLLREARAAAALDNPYAVHIYDVGEREGATFIAMELVEGASLAALLAGKPSRDDVMRWLGEVAEALAAAHDLGLVHRDVKPDNVVIGKDGRARVLDFGIARLSEGASARASLNIHLGALTEEGMRIGTPAYMPPEQLAGEAVDGRADQFAWGVMAYEALSGALPWGPPADAVARAIAITKKLPAPLAEIAPGVPLEIAAVVERALSADREARFASMHQVVAALGLRRASVPSVVVGTGGAVATAPTELAVATTKGKVPATSGSVTGRRLGLVLGAVVLLGCAGFLALRRPREHAPPPAPSAPATVVQAAASVASPSRARAITDWPPPKTSSPEAAALYAEALQALRDGSSDLARADLRKAVAMDPHFAAAHLRLALYGENEEATRKDVAAASAARASLDERDLRFLSLAASPGYPGLGAYPDPKKEGIAVAADSPGDAEAQLLAGLATLDMHLFDRATALDPRFALVESLRALYAMLTGNNADGLAATDRCLAISPRADACLAYRAGIHGAGGQCAEMEQDARRLVAAHPDGYKGYELLLQALDATGAPVEALRQVAGNMQAAAKETDEEHGRALRNDAWFAIHVGDFAATERALLSLRDELASLPFRDDHTAHHELIRLYEEEGDVAKAAAVADDYLRQSPAWIDAPQNDDAVVRAAVLSALLAAGRLPQARALRGEWLEDWRRKYEGSVLEEMSPILLSMATARTSSEARDALASAPAHVLSGSLHAGMAGIVGRAYALEGDADHAIPLLRARVAPCGSPDGQTTQMAATTIYQMRTRLALGEMLEKKSDRDGACAEYAAILARWGNARPRSITADEARTRSKALGCPR